MLNRLWLLFTQAVTILLAAWFIVATLKPTWLSDAPMHSLVDNITIKEGDYDSSSINPGSYHEAVKKSMPAIVNIFTSKVASKPKTRKGTDSADLFLNSFLANSRPMKNPVRVLAQVFW